ADAALSNDATPVTGAVAEGNRAVPDVGHLEAVAAVEGQASGGRTITPDNWFEIVAQLSMPARSLAERCHAINDDDSVVLVIDPGFLSMASKATQERLVAQLQRLGVHQPLRFEVGDTSAAAAPVRAKPAGAPHQPSPDAPVETPAQIRERNEQAAAEAREQSLRDHPAARVIAERAGAELIRESVRPLEDHGAVNEP
ncbi:MAG TPA: hypothetical protein VK979_01115, partial [Guyparkeria sp.]|nr:hypothetical protein [Guyparkeria sp.]